MAYYGGSTTRGMGTFDSRKLFLVCVLAIFVASAGYLALNPAVIKLLIPERVVIKEVPTAPVTPIVQEVFVPRETIWPGQRLSADLFTKETRGIQGLEGRVVNASEIEGSFASTVIPAGTTLLRDSLTPNAPKNALTSRIPPGYRAVTIAVD